MRTRHVYTAVLLFVCAVWLNAQNAGSGDGMKDCPMHAQKSSEDGHHAAVETNGDATMGFSHEKTTHHFRLAESGGAIEVTANDAKDAANIDAIRLHLRHIAAMFADGDFTTPMLVHDAVPPGVTTMRLLKEKIRYSYEAIDGGGRVRLEASDPIALAAIHDFLRFQINDHRTGDPLAIEW
jgi:hypothetical protein